MKFTQKGRRHHQLLCLALGFIAFFSLLVLFGLAGAQEAPKLITLDEAYRAALQSHELISIAGEEIEKSRLLPKKAMSIMIPHVGWEGDYIRLDDEITYTTQTHITAQPWVDQDITVGPTPAVPKEQWIGNLEVKQAIYRADFFPLRRAAFHKVDLSQEAYYETTQGILYDVALAYYETAKSKALVENAKEIIKLAKEGLRVSRVKFDAGNVTEDAVLGSELSVTKAKRHLIGAKNNLKLAKDILARLMGTKGQGFDVTEPAALPVRTENYESLLNTAYEHRYDYKIAKLNVELAEDDVKLTKTKFHPTLRGAWNYYWVDQETYALDEEFWSASITLSVPIFEGGLRILDLKEKRKTRRQAKLAVENLRKSMELEIEGAMLKVGEYGAILSNLKKQVELAEKNYEILSSQYKYGSATALDVDLALKALDSAKTQLIAETYDYQSALLRLEKAIGLFAMGYMTEPRQNK